MAETQDVEQPIAAPILAPVQHNDYDSKFFHRIIQDSGRWAFGVIFAEVWVLNEEKTHLFRPECGWWIDPVATDFGANTKFDRLTNAANADYLEPAPLAPGVGLAGCLWSEVATGNAAARQQDSHGMRGGRLSMRPSMFGGPMDKDAPPRLKGLLATKVAWRQVRPLSMDPDQPYNPRLEYLGKIGLGWAAGVPFSVGSTEGIVVYMARETASERKLQSQVNQDYLIHATLLIGSAYALRVPRLVSEEERKAERKNAVERLKAKVRAVIKMNKNLAEVVTEETGNAVPSASGKMDAADAAPGGAQCSDSIAKKIRTTVKKFLGAANKAPASFTWEQTAWTFAGAFLTLATLTTLNQALIRNYGLSHAIVLGPFGALMTLQYGLTAAPASQPRNAIVGQFVGLFVAHGVGQATNLEPWLKQTLATSLAIACMVKLGVTHPPAGAAALLFSSGQRTWQQIGMMFLGNVIAVACATLVNNLNKRRQYPTFWGLQPIIELVQGDNEAKEEVKKKA